MLTPMYMVVSMHLLWAGANGANLVVDEAVAPWLRLPLPTTTARLPRRATTARASLELDEPMLLHAPFAGIAPPWLHAQRTTQEWG